MQFLHMSTLDSHQVTHASTDKVHSICAALGRVQEKGVCFGVDHLMRHAIDRMLGILLFCNV